MNEYLYWFYPTESFYKQLPERYREKTKIYYENVKKLKRKTSINMDLVKYNSLDLIFKTEPIDLNKQELEQLGFEISKSSLVFTDGEIELYFKKQSCRANFIPSVKIAATKKKYSPTFVSTEGGELPLSYNSSSSDSGWHSLKGGKPSEFINSTNRLVPVRVKKNLIPTESIKEDLIFWFTPTESFFDALPKEIGDEIRQEYHALLVKDNPGMFPVQSLANTTSCKYFEECKVNFDGMVKMNVFPNPTIDLVNIEVEFSKPIEYYIALYDIGGRSVKMLKKSELVAAGSHQHTVSLGNIPKGIYILAIRDNNGSMKIQRVIKQ
jgi:hypothetical protein